MAFFDRVEAGRRLAGELRDHARREALILGLAPGGVLVGRAIGDALVAPVDVLVVEALTIGDEVPFGAVAGHGAPALADAVLRKRLLGPGELHAAVHRARAWAAHREEALRGSALRKPAEGRVVVLAADGLTEIWPALAALDDVRRRGPREVVVASPVIRRAVAEELRERVDKVLALACPEELPTVGSWYENFHRVSDEEIHLLLTQQIAI